MKQIILEQIESLEEKLVSTDPCSSDYGKLLEAIGSLAGVLHTLEGIGLDSAKPVIEKKEEPKEENEFETMTQVPVQKNAPSYTYDQVREICTAAMSSGVVVKDIIKKYSDTGKLTGVPEDKFADLVAEVQNAG